MTRSPFSHGLFPSPTSPRRQSPLEPKPLPVPTRKDGRPGLDPSSSLLKHCLSFSSSKKPFCLQSTMGSPPFKAEDPPSPHPRWARWRTNQLPQLVRADCWQRNAQQIGVRGCSCKSAWKIAAGHTATVGPPLDHRLTSWFRVNVCSARACLQFVGGEGITVGDIA